MCGVATVMENLEKSLHLKIKLMELMELYWLQLVVSVPVIL